MQDYYESIPGINAPKKSKIGLIVILLFGATIVAAGGAVIALRYFGESDLARTIAVNTSFNPAPASTPADTSSLAQSSPPPRAIRNDSISEAFKNAAPAVLADMKTVQTSLGMGDDTAFAQNVLNLVQSYNQLSQIWTDDYLHHNRRYGMTQKRILETYVSGMALIADTVRCDPTDMKSIFIEALGFNATVSDKDVRDKLPASELEALKLAPAYRQKALINLVYPLCNVDEAQTALVQVLDGNGSN